MNISRESLEKELDWAGERRQTPWFDRRLLQEDWFEFLIQSVFALNPQITLRNFCYSILPTVEYIAFKQGLAEREVVCSIESLRSFLSNQSGSTETLAKIVAKHGTQGNIPQRAVVILDYLHNSGILTLGMNKVVELGCSGGLVGCAMVNWSKIVLDGKAEYYFWLKRKTPNLLPDRQINYIGYDKSLPPYDLLPFFIRDSHKRQKVLMFAKDFGGSVSIREETLEQYLNRSNGIPAIIITSFVLYHLRDISKIYTSLIEKVREGYHWIDLSRNSGLDCLFEGGYVPNHVYLSYNGKPVVKIIDGSDDCPN